MILRLCQWLCATPQRLLAVLALTGITMLAFGLYLQHVEGLNPCPMCIVQRYALLGVVLIAAVGSRLHSARAVSSVGVLLFLVAGFGGFTAARQSWLQWYPPEVVSCGRDLYGMIESFPLQRVVPMVFRGSGDCSQVDWTFLGGSLANWSFGAFTGFALAGLWVLWRNWRA